MGGEVVRVEAEAKVESVPWADESWCLVGSLKLFHHVLRSRRFGGDAGVIGTGGCEGGLP